MHGVGAGHIGLQVEHRMEFVVGLQKSYGNKGAHIVIPIMERVGHLYCSVSKYQIMTSIGIDLI